MATSKDFTWDTDMDETFQLVSRSWDVREAKKIIASKRARKVYPIPVASLKALVGTPDTLSLCVRVDWEVAKIVDVSVPLILVQDQDLDTCVPIDGYHRIARAVLDGLTELPAVVLTKAESKKVRIS